MPFLQLILVVYGVMGPAWATQTIDCQDHTKKFDSIKSAVDFHGVPGLADEGHILAMHDFLTKHGAIGFEDVGEHTTTQETDRWIQSTRDFFKKKRNDPRFKDDAKKVFDQYWYFPPENSVLDIRIIPGGLHGHDRGNTAYDLKNPHKELNALYQTVKGLHEGFFDLTKMDHLPKHRIASFHYKSRISLVILEILGVATPANPNANHFRYAN